MGSAIDKLFAYHQLTSRLYLLNGQVATQQRRARAQERKLAEQAGQIEQARETIKKAQAAAHEAELELKTRDAHLDKLRTQLNATKTNKEYSALLREINTYKADTVRVEEQALQKMSAVDELKKGLAKTQQEAEQEQRRAKELQGHAHAREQELARQVEDVTRQRAALASELPADMLAQIERLAAAHDGEAMAAILKQNPKREEYICGGCNMGVTLEQVNALQGRDEVQICNCCGRLLYLGESAQTSSR
jgi:uncharacterized protein